jgi:tetratricopeptide (TPR) repeat protein
MCVAIRNGALIAIAAIGVLAAGGISTASAQGAACTGGGKISKQIAKPMAAAQEAMKAKKWQEVLTRTREAEAVPGAKSQFDQYWMSEFRGYAYHNLRQTAEAARELENGLNSPCMPESGKMERYKALVGLYTALRNYPKVIDYGNRAIKVSRDPDMQVAVAQAYYQSGNNKDAVRVMNEMLADFDKAGRVPKEQQLLLVQAACSKVNDNNCVSRVFEKLVQHYPKPDYWRNLMVALKQTDTNDLQALNVLRLASNVKVLTKADDYKEYAQLALEEKLAGEAQSVLEQGFTNKAFVDERQVSVNQRLLEASKKQAALEKAALAKEEAAAKAAKTGDADIKLGAQYLSFGETAKAIEALQRGITKGGLGAGGTPEVQAQKADEASILLGIAYLKNNNKAEAARAFRSVKRDQTMTRIAKLWLLNT